MGNYQSFEANKGTSLSSEKLARIRLPSDLKGKSVLDLGCNEGFFAIEAKRRGADYVLGLDHDGRLLDLARRRASDEQLEIDFVQADMNLLPDRKFDFVLLLSALHYIDEPAKLMQKIRKVLNEDGSLILEIGLAPTKQGKTIGRALRSIDERFFASPDLLKGIWLKDYSVRSVGPSVRQEGDPLPRYVFHCSLIKTNVLFIRGNGGIGKTSLATQFMDKPVISVDELFAPARFEKPRLHPVQKRYEESFNKTRSIWATWEAINEEPGVKDYFAEVIGKAIKQCSGCGVVIVEGFVLTNLIAEINQQLGSGYQTWIVDKVE